MSSGGLLSCVLTAHCSGMAADPPSWEFEISGKVIEVAEAEGAAAAAAPSAAAQPTTGISTAPPVSKGPPMTSCLRRLTIRLDQQQYPQDGIITWTKALHEGPHKEKFSVRWPSWTPHRAPESLLPIPSAVSDIKHRSILLHSEEFKRPP